MPSKPITLYDARGNRLAFASSNRLIPAAQQNNDRKIVPLLDRDLHRNISALGRRTLMSIGRRVYFECPEIRGAIEEAAELASSVFMPEYRGESKEFKDQAEELLYQHNRWIDVAGWPNTMRSYRKGLIRLCFVDGGVGTVLVEKNGLPFIQVIPAHRIASGPCDLVKEGAYKGRQIIDGVIVDEQLATLAYRVLLGDTTDYSTYQDISSNSMFLSFLPIFPGQVRELSALGIIGWDVQDKHESKRWELLGQKSGAARVFMEFNEEGEAPIGADHIESPSESGAGHPSGMFREVIDGGLNTYFKANTGSRLEAVKFDRPSSNQQAFSAQVTREYFAGSGLSVDFHLDLSKLGGAPLRLLVEKINRSIRAHQQDIIEPAVRRIDAHRISIFQRNGQLPSPPDALSKLEYQPAAELTADKKYDSDVDAQEIRIGVKSRTSSAMKRGETLADVRDTKAAEVEDWINRGKLIFAKHPDVPLPWILSKLEEDSMNGQMQMQQPEKPEEQEEEESTEEEAE